jgi:hypothetical protein
VQVNETHYAGLVVVAIIRKACVVLRHTLCGGYSSQTCFCIGADSSPPHHRCLCFCFRQRCFRKVACLLEFPVQMLILGAVQIVCPVLHICKLCSPQPVSCIFGTTDILEYEWQTGSGFEGSSCVKLRPHGVSSPCWLDRRQSVTTPPEKRALDHLHHMRCVRLSGTPYIGFRSDL